MSSVVTLRHNIVRDGKLRHADLSFIWKPPMFPPAIHPILIKLLTKFDILYPIKQQEGGSPAGGRARSPTVTTGDWNEHSQQDGLDTADAGTLEVTTTDLSGAAGPESSSFVPVGEVSLVPCLLAKVRPYIVKNYWPHYEDQCEQTSRIWEFRFLPLGFFSRLFVRTMNLVERNNSKADQARLDIISYWYTYSWISFFPDTEFNSF